MKKKKLTLGLASSFIAALGLSACSGVSSSNEAIVTYTGYAGEEVNVLTNTIYNKYRESSDGIAMYYNAILESIIRYEFDSNPSGVVYKKSNAQIKTEAENNVSGEKSKAEENAKTNNTSYSTEWDKILSSYDCEDEDELLEHFIYQIEKTEISDKYFADNKDALTQEYIGVDDEGQAVESKAKSSFPYHIRHVLVSISEGETEYYHGTISQDQAKKLGSVISYLEDDSYTFADVAKKLSGDSGSAAKGGDVGIMTPSTSFVNEFKLGIYAYDAVFAGREENSAIESGLGLDAQVKIGASTTNKSVKEAIQEVGLKLVPHDAFVKIGDEAETELVYGKKINDGNSNYYPRNIYWNNYLNFHNPFVITNQAINSSGETVIDSSITDFSRWSEPNEEGIRFLTDENGHIIIGVRSSHGIHLMITQKSIYEFNEGGKQTSVPSLEEYYTTSVPTDENFPSYTVDETSVKKSTYVNFIKTSEATEYNTRANEIKTAIKSFDSGYDYRLYEDFVASGKIHFNETDGINLGEKIAEYINASRNTNKNSSEDTLTSSWKTYLEQIAVQNQEKNYVTGIVASGLPHEGESIKRVINVRCAIGFKSDAAQNRTGEWAQGGMCYYEE